MKIHTLALSAFLCLPVLSACSGKINLTDTGVSPIAAAKIACAHDGLPRPLTIKWHSYGTNVFHEDDQSWYGMSDETPVPMAEGTVYCGGQKKTVRYHSQVGPTSMDEINSIQNAGGLDQYKDDLDNDAARRFCSPRKGEWDHSRDDNDNVTIDCYSGFKTAKTTLTVTTF